MPDRPSIGIILHDFSLGGTERIATRLAQRWADLGCRVVIFCGSRSGGMSSLLHEGVEVVEARPAIRRAKRSRVALARAAARYFGRYPVDICFVPGNFHWPVVGPVARLRGRRRPKVVVQVSAALRKPQRNKIKQIAFDLRMRWLLRGADAIVTLAVVAERQAGKLLRRSLIRTISLPAIDDDAPGPLPVPDGPPIILGVGRLVPEKGFATLIAAFARTADPAARLVIVGAGPDEDRLRGIAEAEGVADRVELPGFAADPRPWFDRARLFVLSSHYEGYAAVLVEALAAGRMVVATDCTPAAAELVDDPAVGQVVPIDDPQAMAHAIDALLATPPTDPATLAAKVERFRMGPVAEAYLGLFAGLRGRR
ncbi:glycosyltransferase [Sphingomonas naphthae]|uniref:Glycosyltransferase n=1 Tax=Sphingomonas naphthae TaxID=1813468 RepID=A0ABY7TN82_9SPHN|nr:glycosyltransferase [Sphingomonas naphthae]WCT73314.1 glycosyltransferase [Sphingomonas naphthae]